MGELSASGVSPHDRRRIAVEAFCTEKSVENVLLGRSKPLVVERVRKAAQALGIEIQLPSER